jgi:hypothetical protein
MDLFSFITGIEGIASKLNPDYDAKNKFPAVSELVDEILNNIII